MKISSVMNNPSFCNSSFLCPLKAELTWRLGPKKDKKFTEQRDAAGFLKGCELKRYGIMLPARRPCGFFRIHGWHCFLCSEQYDYRIRSCTGSPFLHVPEAETVFRYSLPRSLPGWIVLYDHEHGWFRLGAEKETHARREKAVR